MFGLPERDELAGVSAFVTRTCRIPGVEVSTATKDFDMVRIASLAYAVR